MDITGELKEKINDLYDKITEKTYLLGNIDLEIDKIKKITEKLYNEKENTINEINNLVREIEDLLKEKMNCNNILLDTENWTVTCKE